MQADTARIIARILDGIRPAQDQPRGRPLQLFIGADETVRLQEPDLASTASETRYQFGGLGAKFGTAKFASSLAITITVRTDNFGFGETGSRFGLAKFA